MAKMVNSGTRYKTFKLKTKKMQHFYYSPPCLLSHVGEFLTIVRSQPQFCIGQENNLYFFVILPHRRSMAPPNIFIAYGAVYFASTLNSGQSDGSAIFDFIGIKFIYHQSTQIQARDLKFFTTAEREVFVTVANYQYYTLQSNPRQKVKSAVYKMADKKLNLYQQLPTTGAVYMHVFKHKGKIYVAVVNRFNGTGYNINSQIYIWNWTVAIDSVVCIQTLPRERLWTSRQ